MCRSAAGPGNAERRFLQVARRRRSRFDAEFRRAVCPRLVALSVWAWRRAFAPEAAGDPAVPRPGLEFVGAICGGAVARGAETHSGRGPRASHRSAGRGVMWFSGGALWVADGGAPSRKAPLRVSRRSTCRKPRASAVSGRGRDFTSNTASSIRLPFVIPATILARPVMCESGVGRGAGKATPHRTPMPYMAFARAGARQNARRAPLFVPHATGGIGAIRGGRWFASPGSAATRAPIPRDSGN
ncbi:hypothetical protein TCDM_13269 [Trypanosoma cruzi Dm28c]|uniref:Uncharacterized protein n=1 Tax=Trypanosoma cruzi Dm28c TaxID=1416333 RepID=V5AJ33_TRYCR|nr:hypothetical protein TCDM_13269 [Trypanosoma cruzi Dm28c]